MTKCQEALDFIKEQLKLKYKVKDIHVAELVAKSFEDLQELVDKATGEKPYLGGDCDRDTDLFYTVWICPICGKEYDINYDGKHNYCPQCGQSIDWSDYA